MSENHSRKSPLLLALVTIIGVGGGWYFLQNYEVEGLDGLSLTPRGNVNTGDDDLLLWSSLTEAPSPTASQSRTALLADREGIPSTLASSRSPAELAADAPVASESAGSDIALTEPSNRPVRVGSWALAGFDRNKLAKPHVMDYFSRVVRQFDVVALQQITSHERDLMPRAIAHLNQSGRRYDFVLGPVVGPHGADIGRLGEQYAFVFDTETIEIDRGQTYTVNDPSNLISYDPLVAWFRARAAPLARAWTFSLVNFRVDSSQPNREVALIGKLLDSVAKDGRGEDDLLLTGMLHADDRQLLMYLGSDTCNAAVRSTPTDIFGRYQLSNIISPRKATTEYLGRGGVVDFPHAFDLTETAAEELSPHLPVFAEFAPSEGN